MWNGILTWIPLDPLNNRIVSVVRVMADRCLQYANELVGSSTTVPGTSLGEGERVNLIRPSAVSLGIHFNLSVGAIVSISEVR